MIRNFFWVLVLMGLIAGCSSVAVQRDYDTSVDFSVLKRYAWLHEKQPEVGDPRVDNDIMDVRVRAAVDARLSSVGLKKVPRQQADCLVAYYVDFDRRMNASTVTYGLGTGRYTRYGYYGGVGYRTDITETDYGILTIDMMNVNNEKTIWRGTGTRSVYQGSDPSRAKAIVDSSVSRILEGFPPHL